MQIFNGILIALTFALTGVFAQSGTLRDSSRSTSVKSSITPAHKSSQQRLEAFRAKMAQRKNNVFRSPGKQAQPVGAPKKAASAIPRNGISRAQIENLRAHVLAHQKHPGVPHQKPASPSSETPTSK